MFDPTPLPTHTDVLVVGGGVMGASTAFHLAGLGRGVLVVDRGPLAAEASSQGAGFLCSIRSTVESSRITYFSSSFYARFREETGFEIDLHLTGGVRVALTETWLAQLRTEAAAGQAVGADSHELSPAEIRALVPALTADHVVGGIFTPSEGYMTATRDAAIGLARAAVRRGATIRTHVEVNDIDRTGSGEFQIGTSHGPITAGTVVIATNAATWPLARSLRLDAPAYPILHECAVYDISDAMPQAMPTVRVGERDVYIRREAGGLLIGGVGNDPHGPAVDAPAEVFQLARIEPDREELASARRRATPFFPGLERGVCLREQRGLLLVAPDLEPMAGEWMPGLFLMSADLRGIQSAPALGLLVAQLIVGGDSEFNPAPYRPTRFAEMARDPAAVRDAALAGLRPRWRT